MTRAEGYITGFEDCKLFFQTWEHPQAIGTILITHGQAEHSECYVRLIESLNKIHKWNIIAWDLRGHGRSEGKRGFAYHFNDYCEDFWMVYHKIKNSLVTNKFVLLSHSMGGLIQIKSQLDHPDITANAQVFSSPLLGLNVQIPELKKTLADVLYMLLPDMTLSNELNYKDLTRDPEIIAEFKKDNLRHEKISPGVFIGFNEAMEQVHKKAEQIKIPSYFQIAGQDKIVNPLATRQFVNNMTLDQKTVSIYADSYHEIYNDINREEVFRDLNSYLAKV